jgi:hypothetical protein
LQFRQYRGATGPAEPLNPGFRVLLPFQLGRGALLLVTRDGDGRWVNAVDTNVGGTPRFVIGPYKWGYPLGTYGIDVTTRTLWAVVNHEGDFAAAASRQFER